MKWPFSASRHWLRFSVVNLLVLTLGIALGFLPLKLWELGEPAEPRLLVHLKVVDVDRDSLPALGAAPAGKVSDVAAGTSKRNESVYSRLESLQQAGQAKIVAEPTLVATNGKRTWLKIGGEFPFPEPDDNGAITVGFKHFGTCVEVEPTLLRNGRIRLVISLSVSEIDMSRAYTVSDVTIPGIRARSVETTLELADGETAVLSSCADQSQPSASGREVVIVARVERTAGQNP